jgi:hypothetical protein
MTGTHEEPELKLCQGFWHRHDIREQDPTIVALEQAICTSFRLADKWGFFDRSGKVIPEATDYFGPDNAYMFQVPELSCDVADVPDLGKSGLIFGGRVNLHFGHFLLETLPRLWSIARAGLGGRKVLYQSGFALSDWYNRPFVKPCFEALRIRESDIVQCTGPEIVRDVLVPLPCVQQNSWIHRDAARSLFKKIGTELLTGDDDAINEVPVYLSKTRYKQKGTGIINEIDLEENLAKLGVEIIYPETLSLADQIRIFRNRKTIIGALGSAFHTAAFAQPAGRQIILAHNYHVNSNYRLFDIAGGNDPEYYYSNNIIEIGKTPEISYTLRCEDPQAVAKALYDLI